MEGEEEERDEEEDEEKEDEEDTKEAEEERTVFETAKEEETAPIQQERDQGKQQKNEEGEKDKEPPKLSDGVSLGMRSRLGIFWYDAACSFRPLGLKEETERVKRGETNLVLQEDNDSDSSDSQTAEAENEQNPRPPTDNGRDADQQLDNLLLGYPDPGSDSD
uniref:Uncharacterized protein n=1 Tax=Chromera velia CCMP2878 TaxID=1169474 RepID=A0A0G4FLE5_9ALVE|eukprot:Cvel_17632.t1-p1 / transcript=Cvel_17632.t1 / gene=Cvel_17632 / organism=Chromera_velia_CCMP2878 / gene_product=hypothetical protein / transcript_product=hypothetical protein / location=Cvel_scaffold1419:37574-38059(-) / protein_length=162 / sequence_SO=supercontig / SO=protein_coding / is_pseudo=false